MPNVSDFQNHKYRHKLRNKDLLWSWTLIPLMEELKRSLDDLSAPHIDPDLDLWIDQIMAVIATKFGPDSGTRPQAK